MKGGTAVTRQSTAPASASCNLWERLEEFVRERIQRMIQAVLEEEITELLGRAKEGKRGQATFLLASVGVRVSVT